MNKGLVKTPGYKTGGKIHKKGLRNHRTRVIAKIHEVEMRKCKAQEIKLKNEKREDDEQSRMYEKIAQQYN